MASHTIGVMSTPNAGGTAPRMARSSGSVGHAAKLKGSLLRSVFGYHEITTRQSLHREEVG